MKTLLAYTTSFLIMVGIYFNISLVIWSYGTLLVLAILALLLCCWVVSEYEIKHKKILTLKLALMIHFTKARIVGVSLITLAYLYAMFHSESYSLMSLYIACELSFAYFVMTVFNYEKPEEKDV